MLPKLGRYETLKKIASGGMATVYLGRVVGEGGFERLVALKVMHPHIASDPDFVGMFLDEARLAARIRHPNVVATIDIQKTDEAMFIVMDYVDGPTVQEVRKHLKSRDERIPIPVVLRIFIDILNGLQDAHDLTNEAGEPLNLVHRDVSPHNILIGQDGRAQLTDFGVAKAEARISSTRGGQLKGKIAYMPPEQIVAQPVTRAADVYSAGVCLWESLVGKRLFRAANDGALVHMILDGKPTPPSKYCDDIPAALEGVVLKAISRKAVDRYQEAIHFAEALEDAAREARLRIPKQRDVGKFIKQIVAELGRTPVSRKSLTPPSAPSARHPSKSDSGNAGVSQPSMPSLGTGPSHPQSRPESSEPRALPSRQKVVPGGPPPIPNIGSDPNLKVPKPKPKARPPNVSTPEIHVDRAIAFDIEDPPTDVMHHVDVAEAMAELVNNSQPSVVTSPTSPTQTDATYSLAPPPSRSGVIAVVVAGAFALAVLVVVVIGGPEDTEPQPGITPIASPQPSPEPSPALSAPPPDPPDSSAPPVPSVSTSASAPPPKGSVRLLPGQPGPRPAPSATPTGSVFKPKTL